MEDEVKFHNQTKRQDGAFGVGLVGSTGAPAYGEAVYPDIFGEDTHHMWNGGCGNWWVPNLFPFRWSVA